MLEHHLDEKTDSAVPMNIIREKQRLLKRVIIITRAIERMQDSLNSVLILGRPSTDIPDGMLKYFHLLSDKIKQKSTDKICRYLSQLELTIKLNLQEIINISMLENDIAPVGKESNGEEKPYSDEAMHLLREFNRQAQTAVSLKILLQQRGVNTHGTVVKIPIQLIKRQLQQLAKKEEIQRNKIRAHISDMQNDLKSMLNNSEYTDEMKEVFRDVMAGLERDMSAISQGVRIDQLPFSFEVIETGDEKQHRMQSAVKQDEVSRIDHPEEKYRGDAVDPPEYVGKPEDELVHSRKRGFFRTLVKWLNTPWSVTWETIIKGGNKEK